MAAIDDILKYLRDLDRQLAALQRLDVNPPVTSVPKYSGTPTANAIAYWPGAGTVAGDRAIYVNSGGSVGIGTVSPGQLVHLAQNVNAAMRLRVQNTNAGTVAQAGIDVVNDANKTLQWFVTSSAYTTNGVIFANLGYFNANGIPLMFRTSADDMFFVVNASTEVLRLLSSGVITTGGLTSAGASQLGVKAGSSSNDAAVGGVLYVDTTQYANGTTVDTDLASYTVPAATLAVNNQSLTFEIWGTLAASANTKTVRVKFGADSFTAFTTVSSGKAWSVKGRIIRTGAATQKVVITSCVDASSPTVVSSTAGRTLSGSNILKSTGQSGTASSDILQEGFIVGYDDANT